MRNALTVCVAPDRGELPDTWRERFAPSRRDPLLAASGELEASSGSLHVALCGAPRWLDAALQSRARETGHARTLIEAWRLHGPDCLKFIDGHWSLAVHDASSARTLLAVDALGIEPLAWAAKDGRIIAHTRADEVARAIGAGIDRQGLYDYLYCHMVPAPGTVWTGVRKLRPGSRVLIEGGQVREERWWFPAWREPERADFDERARALVATLSAATARALDDGTPAAAFLSGGLDSSSVVAMAARVRGHEVDAFAMGFAAEGYDEMAFARAAARHSGVRLHQRYVTPEDVLAAIPEVCAAYDEPFGNASAVPALICALTAREAGFTRLLAGDGGDEIFGGNARYARQQVFEPWLRLPAAVRGVLGPLLDNAATRALPGLQKAASYVRQASVPLPDRLESYNFLHRHEPAQILTPEFLRGIDCERPLAGMRERWATANTDSLVKRMLDLDLEYTLADNDLRKVNRMCCVAGVEVRYPMLDLAMVDLAAGLPQDWLVRSGELRWFYRRAMQGVLAPETLSKSKHGFGLPFGVWLREHTGLREMASAHLDALRRRGWFREDWIDFLLREHREGHADYYGVMIWVMVLLEAWMQGQEG